MELEDGRRESGPPVLWRIASEIDRAWNQAQNSIYQHVRQSRLNN